MASSQQLGQLFEGVKQRAEADVAAARAAQDQAEAEAARAEERAAAAIRFKDDEARRHAEELRRLETAYEDTTEVLTAASAAHQARAERAEAEAARLREPRASAEDEHFQRFFTSMPAVEDAETAATAMEQLGHLLEDFKQRAESDVAAARTAQHQAEVEAARAEARAATAIQAKDDEARRHTEELRRLEKAYENKAEALTTTSATHLARAERAEAEAARLREELAGRQ